MTENEHTKPIEPWQIALQLKHQQAVANTIRTAVRMLARQTNAEALFVACMGFIRWLRPGSVLA